jgi:hypothetical protein
VNKHLAVFTTDRPIYRGNGKTERVHVKQWVKNKDEASNLAFYKGWDFEGFIS